MITELKEYLRIQKSIHDESSYQAAQIIRSKLAIYNKDFESSVKELTQLIHERERVKKKLISIAQNDTTLLKELYKINVIRNPQIYEVISNFSAIKKATSI